VDDELEKILQLVSNGSLSQADAMAIFQNWREQGKQILINKELLTLLTERASIIKPETGTETKIKEKPVAQQNIFDILGNEIIAIAAKSLKINAEELSLTTPMESMGMDSVIAAEITVHFKEKYRISITPPMLFEVRNFSEYIDLLFANFKDIFTSYYKHDTVEFEPFDDVKPTGPSLIGEDDQNVSFVKDEALFENNIGFDSIWSKLEEEDKLIEELEPDTYKEKKVSAMEEGNSIILSHDDQIVEFISYGSGEPLLLIGGLGNDIKVWEKQLPTLADYNKVLVFYPPGHGKSTLDEKNQTMEDIAKLLHRALSELNINTAINVIGYSLGGNIAIQLTLNYPQLVDSLVLISTSAQSIAQDGAFSKVTKEFSKLEKVVPHAAEYFPFSEPATLNFYKHTYKNYDVADKLHNIHCPVLILTGNDDEYISAQFSKEIHERITASKLIIIPSAGHYALLTHAGVISNNIDEFIGR